MKLVIEDRRPGTSIIDEIITVELDVEGPVKGTTSVEIDSRLPIVVPEVIKNQIYDGKLPVVVVYKTSKYSDAKTKIKVFNHTNIDWVVTQEHLPGIPDRAIVLDIGLGSTFIEKFKKEYKVLETHE